MNIASGIGNLEYARILCKKKSKSPTIFICKIPKSPTIFCHDMERSAPRRTRFPISLILDTVQTALLHTLIRLSCPEQSHMPA